MIFFFVSSEIVFLINVRTNYFPIFVAEDFPEVPVAADQVSAPVQLNESEVEELKKLYHQHNHEVLLHYEMKLCEFHCMGVGYFMGCA